MRIQKYGDPNINRLKRPEIRLRPIVTFYEIDFYPAAPDSNSDRDGGEIFKDQVASQAN